MATRTIPFTIDKSDDTGLLTTGSPTATVQYGSGAAGSTTVTQRGNGWSVDVDDTQDALVIVTATGATTFGFTVLAGKVVSNADKTGYQLTAAYDAAKTAAPSGEAASALASYDPPTRAEATADKNAVIAALPATPTAAQNATAVRSELATELARIDATVSSRATAADVGGEDPGDTVVTHATLGTDNTALGTVAPEATITASVSGNPTWKRQTVAEADGQWSLRLPPGATYTLRATRTGYRDTTAEVTV